MFLLKAQARRSRILVGSSHATSGRSRTRSRRPSATSKRTWRRRAAGRVAAAVGEEGGGGAEEGAVGAGAAGRGRLPPLGPLAHRSRPGIDGPPRETPPPPQTPARAAAKPFR